MRNLPEVLEFEWDKGNIGKNRKHKVEESESEEAFFDEDRIIFKDIFHSKDEERFILLGKTKQERSLYVIFTLRKNKIRIISARNINKREAHLYEKET